MSRAFCFGPSALNAGWTPAPPRPRRGRRSTLDAAPPLRDCCTIARVGTSGLARGVGRCKTREGVQVLPLNYPDWRLRWPRDVFVRELEAVLARPDNGEGPAGELLLREAFTGTGPVEVFDQAKFDGRAVLAELSRRRTELREETAARAPYRIERVRAATGSGGSDPDWDRAKRAFKRLFTELDSHGYFDQAWGVDCVDDRRDWAAVTDALESALGLPNLWPFDTREWSEDLFLSVIEVVHDAVARPRVVVSYHSYADCGEHYGSYAPEPGQAIFRFRVKRIFEEAGIPFRLASSGEDYGRVVAVTDDAREELLERVVVEAQPSESAEIGHAIALFRSRTATRENKRSAISTLARILEQHRATLKEELFTQDEGALFRIANEFDIRHSNDKQRSIYDDSFLDWVFWWYLGTVELIKALKAREHRTTS